MTMLAGCAATIVAPPQQQQQQGMPATALIVLVGLIGSQLYYLFGLFAF